MANNSLRKEKMSEQIYETGSPGVRRKKGSQKRKTRTGASSGRKTGGQGKAASAPKSKKAIKAIKASGESTLLNKRAEESGIRMGNEVTIIVSFCLMILMLLSNFGLCGTVGKVLKSLFFGIFGLSQYAMPVVAFIIVLMLIANDYNVLSVKKSAALLLLMLMISAFSQLISEPSGYPADEIFGDAATNPFLGGVVAGGFTELLRSGFGTIGAGIILFCILALSFVMLTQRSVLGFFRKTGRSVSGEWKRMKDQRALRKELKAEKEESRLQEIDAIYDMEEDWSFPDEDGGHRPAPGKVAEDKVEDKVREIKGQILESRTRDKGRKKSRVEVPVFVPDEKNKTKDSLVELKPEIFPLTAEDGETDPFRGELDYSAFTRAEPASLPEIAFHQDNSPDKIASRKALLSAEEILPPAEDDKDPAFGDGTSEDDFFHMIEEKEDETEAGFPEVEPATVEYFGAGSDKTVQSVRKKKTEKKTEEYEMTPVITPDADRPAGDAAMSDRRAEDPVKAPATSEAPAFDEEEKSRININRASRPKPLSEKAGKADTSYIYPPMSLLTKENQEESEDMDGQLRETALKLQQTLQSFGVNVRITDISCGPSVTRYELFPEQGVKVSKIVSLTDDIKLNLAAADIRIEAPIPGKAAIGIEVPNKQKQTVHFRDLIDNRTFRNMKSRLSFAAGKDISGKIVMADLSKMPHLLVAGTTGSGKSVFINTIIMSILYKASPEEVRFIMVDPKMVELSVYNGIPHLLIPVVTDPKKASGALNWAVAEMTDRYKRFAETGTRNLSGYNKRVEALIRAGEVSADKLNKLPQIVIIIDELADLMMVAKSEVEDAIVRLSQLARAAGIHMVIATQRPSVDVITGLIKANVPSRVALSVSSGTDSRTIIDMNGAEKLLGNGDMLFYPSGYQKPVRVQGAFISDEDIIRITDFLKDNAKIASYDEQIVDNIEKRMTTESSSVERDEYFEAAARFVVEKDKATIGMLQRMFKIGFNRAARIIDQLYEAGIVGPEEGTKPRKVLVSAEELDL